MMRISVQSFGICIGFLALLAGTASAETLRRIEDSGTIRIGYRTDALPHSYEDASGRPQGYIIDLCREVVVAVQTELKPATVRAEFVRVTSQDRFEAVRDGRVDILCEASSITMARRSMVDFSIPTFVDGAGIAFRGKEITRFEDFAGRKVGVLAGTTTHDLLRTTLAALGIKAEIILANDHRSGIGNLIDGRIDSYFADRAILAYLYGRTDTNRNFRIGRQYFSYETYALALPRGDTEFRWLVDRTLAQLARDGRMAALASRNFSIASDRMLDALIAINSVPED